MIAWFAKNGVAANLLMGVILIAGIFSVRGLKMELFPPKLEELITDTVSVRKNFLREQKIKNQNYTNLKSL